MADGPEVHFYFVRHGQSTSNAQKNDIISGHDFASELTDLGRQQCLTLAGFFESSGIFFDRVYTSSAARAQASAYIGARHFSPLSIVTTEDILEQGQGDFEGQKRLTIYFERQDVRRALDDNNWDFVPGDVRKGESQKATGERMIAFIHNVMKSFPSHLDLPDVINIGVFTHGNAMKFMRAELLDLPRKDAFQFVIPNASVHLVKMQGKKMLDYMIIC